MDDRCVCLHRRGTHTSFTNSITGHCGLCSCRQYKRANMLRRLWALISR